MAGLAGRTALNAATYADMMLRGRPPMAATDIGMARLGVSGPKSWDTASWLSDAIPHLAYGAVTWPLLAR